MRAWARWFSDNSSASEQGLLDTVWTHWLPDEQNELNSVLQNSCLFLSRTRDPPTDYFLFLQEQIKGIIIIFPRLMLYKETLKDQ